MKKSFITISILATVFTVAGYSTSNHTSSNISAESVCDSNKTIFYEVHNQVYRSQFYNTTQTIVINNFRLKGMSNIFTPEEIKYFSTPGLPTMNEIQFALYRQQDLESFWDVLDDLWEDAKYLSCNTIYEPFYFETHQSAVVYKESFDDHIHILSDFKNN